MTATARISPTETGLNRAKRTLLLLAQPHGASVGNLVGNFPTRLPCVSTYPKFCNLNSKLCSKATLT